jgi:hypothetical protein
MSTLIVALVLLPVALALGTGLVVLLARPLIAPFIAAVERWRFRRCVTHSLRGEARLRERQLEPALREMEQGFCLLTVRADPRLPDHITRHHAGLLARLLGVADDLPQGRVRLLALAKVDRLLDRRGDMQRAYTQLRTRPLRDARRRQLERELRRNARETRAAVRELVADLQLLSTRKIAYQ